MKEQKLKLPKVDKSWTLFLDRDGVINKKIKNGYVLNVSMFEFLDGVLSAFPILSQTFGRIIVITNQRGIGRGLMSTKDLESIHNFMIKEIEKVGGKIDAVFYCPHDYEREKCSCRKPNIGMALQSKERFKDIDFKKSIVVGDSLSDIEFGKNIGAYSVFIDKNNKKPDLADFSFKNLYEFALHLKI